MRAYSFFSCSLKTLESFGRQSRAACGARLIGRVATTRSILCASWGERRPRIGFGRCCSPFPCLMLLSSLPRFACASVDVLHRDSRGRQQVSETLNVRTGCVQLLLGSVGSPESWQRPYRARPRTLLTFGLSCFSFGGSLYLQTHGQAMGASMSVTTANLVVGALEGKVLATVAPAPRFSCRYLDDCSCILKKQHVPSLLDSLNGQNAHTPFTVELEQDNALPSLGVVVRRDAGALTFSVYRKPTHAGRYLSFASCHPVGRKASVVSSLHLFKRQCTEIGNALHRSPTAIPHDLWAKLRMQPRTAEHCVHARRPFPASQE